MTASQAVLLSTLFLANLSPVRICEAVTPLRIMFLTAFTGDFDSSGTVPAIEIALERINQDSSVLPGYQLQTVPVRDSECAELPSQRAFLNQVLFNETIIAVIGAGCTAATKPIAEISNYWGLSMISYVSSAVVLSDRSRFQNFFRLYPSEENYIPALVAVIKKFGWRRVGIVTQNAVLFNDNMEILSELLRQENITVVLRRTGPNDVPALLSRDVDIRVIFLNMYENEARRFLCQAKRSGAGGFGDTKYEYAWLTYGWYGADWWTVNDTICTSHVLKSVITRAIAIQQYPIAANRSATAVGGLNYRNFQRLYRERAGTNYNTTYFGHIAYDCMWTLALALNKTMNMINTNNTLGCGSAPVPLEEFSYGNSTTACLIRDNLENTDFTGLSGQVEFDSNGTRSDATVRILQYRESENDALELVRFASYSDETETATFLPNETIDSIFPVPVLDGTPINMVITFHIALVVLLYIAAAAGIVFTIICCLFNTIFKKKRIIRLTSPNLNYFMIVGAFMVYFSVFIRVLPTTDMLAWEFICSVPVWLDFIGYTLAFSTILVKMWRIYYIFHNPAPNKRSLTDWHMVALILLITMVMVIIIVIGFAIPEVRPTPQLMNDTEQPPSPNENGIIVRHFSYSCYQPQATVWLIILYAFLVLLQIVAVVFALQTRKVKIKALNESKEVAVIIYVASIMVVGIAIVAFTLRSYKNISEIFLSGGLITATTVFLLVVFIPKMYRLYKDPTGEDVYSAKEGGDTSVEIGKRGTIKVVTDKDRIADLEKRVVILQTELDNKRASQFHGESISSEISSPRSDSCEKECQSATGIALEYISPQSAKLTTDISSPNNCSTVDTVV